MSVLSVSHSHLNLYVVDSGFYNYDPYWAPHNAFDGEDKTRWGNDPDWGFYIGYDFSFTKTVKCVILDQHYDEYVREADLWYVSLLLSSNDLWSFSLGLIPLLQGLVEI
jgi:hypothetical protein